MANNLEVGVDSLYVNQANQIKKNTWQKIAIKIVLLLVACIAVFLISKSVIPILIGIFIWLGLYGVGHYIAKWDVF